MKVSDRKRFRKKGFTLVELLIVIIIIGILAGITMISTGSATDKAEAARIVADLRNIKSACLLHYADKGTWPGADITDVEAYLDQKPADGYKLEANGGTMIFATYDGEKMTGGVKEKLAQMQREAGLTDGPASGDYTGGDTVGIIVRK